MAVSKTAGVGATPTSLAKTSLLVMGKNMEKIKGYLQYVIKPWHKARELVQKYPNAALFALMAVSLAIVANFR